MESSNLLAIMARILLLLPRIVRISEAVFLRHTASKPVYMSSIGKNATKKKKLLLFWIAAATTINIFGQNIVNSYSACLLPGLRHPDSSIKVDLDSGSWIASSAGFSKVLGFPLAAFLMQRFGRPKAYASLAVPGIIGWIFIYLAKDIPTLILGRMLGGISASGCGILGFIIVGEYSSPASRGIYMNLKTSASVFAGLFVHILGNYLHWRTIALVSIIPSVVSLLMALTWPESPSWLVSKNRFKDFENTFYSIRGVTESSAKECEAMMQAQRSRVREMKKSFKEDVKWHIRAFTDKMFYKPLLILVISFLVVEGCGKHVFPAFALDIVSSINNDKSYTFHFVMALDTINVVSTSLSCLLIKVAKIRTLLFSTGAAALAVILSLSLYLFLVEREMLSPLSPFFSVSLLAVYFVIVNMASIPLCVGLIGELMPLQYRSFGLLIVGVSDCIVFSLALKLSPLLLACVQLQGMFVVAAAVTSSALVYLYFTLPETRGRSLQEIEDFFTYGRFLDETPRDDAKITMLKKSETEN